MSDTAVLVVDMLNDYRHADAEQLTASVAEVIEPLSGLIDRAAAHEDAALIWVNDNRGDFTAEFGDLVQTALGGERPDLVEPILPRKGCRFLTKVRHSAFYATSLAYLLNRLGTKRLIVTGQVTEQCILYTALDAYVRHFDVVVPHDAVAHIDPELSDAALTMMKRNMRAEIVSAADCLR